MVTLCPAAACAPPPPSCPPPGLGTYINNYLLMALLWMQVWVLVVLAFANASQVQTVNSDGSVSFTVRVRGGAVAPWRQARHSHYACLCLCVCVHWARQCCFG